MSAFFQAEKHKVLEVGAHLPLVLWVVSSDPGVVSTVAWLVRLRAPWGHLNVTCCKMKKAWGLIDMNVTIYIYIDNEMLYYYTFLFTPDATLNTAQPFPYLSSKGQ